MEGFLIISKRIQGKVIIKEDIKLGISKIAAKKTENSADNKPGRGIVFFKIFVYTVCVLRFWWNYSFSYVVKDPVMIFLENFLLEDEIFGAEKLGFL